MLKYVIIIALAVNAISFFVVARLNKHVINRGVWQTGFNETTTYLICGMMPRSEQPFDWLLDENCPIRGGVHVVSYQNFGFDPRVAANQLGYDICCRSRNAIFITMSIGAEIPLLLSTQHQHIAIDPCLGRQSLKRFSLALLADWLYWATANLSLEESVFLDDIITSSYDEITDGTWLDERVNAHSENCRRRVPCGHCDVENFGSVYKADLSSILQCVTDFRIFSHS